MDISKHNVEVATVVPLMVYKMLKHNAEDLKSLSCIVSDGAELNPKLVIDIYNTLGEVVYNLYGTSETGLNTMATPQDLLYSTKTVGKRIEGVHLKILDENKNEVNFGNVGQLCIKNKWSMRNSKSSRIETGDLGYRDCKGYYFLCGRVDDMVVSAGEKVYPVEIEQALINHPQVEDVAVIGINDEGFGQRLKAYVLTNKNADLTEKELLEWLTYRIARFQMPKEIAFVNHLPYTSLGKLDKKQLKMK
ncbi:MAG: AMP-binding protein [Desulfitobacterium hafniense]|nr:AMP-binding protein [Desulfosporosinus sp.]MDA8222799.1 AMP-binding protein [Desulfitobacterium hafniense]